MSYHFLNTHCHFSEPVCERTARVHARQVLHRDWPHFNFWGI